MPATVMIDEAVSYFSQAPSGTVDPENPTIVRGLRVFRTGTFRDSKGRKRSFSHDDLDKMVDNFSTLRERGSLPNVPVRADHSESVNSIVGYFEGLQREGDFLLADVDFTEPEALKKFERKTYRGRSLEVAPYRSNDETIYQPCVLGLAFVDLPAVEGLYSHESRIPAPIEETDPVSEENAPKPATFRIKGVETSDEDAVQAYIEELEARPPASDPATYRLSGIESQDPDAVQNHIGVLETFRADVMVAARSDFVKELAEDGKIAATQIDAMSDFAQSLDEEGFQKFQASYEGAEGSSLFGKHGDADSAGDPPVKHVATQAEIDADVVAEFRRAGWDEEKIAQTESAKRLAAQAK